MEHYLELFTFISKFNYLKINVENECQLLGNPIFNYLIIVLGFKFVTRRHSNSKKLLSL